MKSDLLDTSTVRELTGMRMSEATAGPIGRRAIQLVEDGGEGRA
jgi:hypothetical protein